jgi:hypothetical protein
MSAGRLALPGKPARLKLQEGAMKRLILPLGVFCLGLFIADYFFGIPVLDLFQGFGNFLKGLFIDPIR